MEAQWKKKGVRPEEGQRKFDRQSFDVALRDGNLGLIKV